MFKKPFKISQKHNQSGKERKKLQGALECQFDKQAISELFKETKNFVISKIEKSKTIIISDETDPLIVDTTGKGDYYPTIYLLNRYPQLVKIVFLLKPGVENFIFKGANLMWPGVACVDTHKNFYPEELVAIVTADGIVCAIGATACDQKEYEMVKGKEGIAALILQSYGDELFNWGSKEIKMKGLDKCSKDTAQNSDQPSSKKSTKDNLSKETANDKDERLESEAALFEKNQNSLKADHKEPLENDENGQLNIDDVQKMDEFIIEAFFNALKLVIKDDMLPLENSYLWNRYIVPCKLPDATIDIKRSSFKKLGKFYQEMDKQNIIKYGEASKKITTPQIVRINRQNQRLKDWKPNIKKPAAIEEQSEDKKIVREKIAKINNLVKAQVQLHKYLSQELTEYVFYDQFVKILAEGLTNLGLMKNNNVILTNELKKNLNFETKVEEPVKANINPEEDSTQIAPKPIKKNEHITYKSFLKRIDRFLSYRHQIILPNGTNPVTKPGKYKGIFISAERIQNKFVTKVFGLLEYGIKLEPLLSEWQIKYGTSGTIHSSTSNKDIDRFIGLQGIFVDELRDFISAEFKIPKSMIEGVNKTGKTKKKIK